MGASPPGEALCFVKRRKGHHGRRHDTKGLPAAAVAAGTAALVPGATAGAEETATDAGQLSALGLEVERDADLQGTAWAEAASQAETAAPAINVVRSDNGIHNMNVPGYFMFSGWDKEHDQPTDNGFGMSGTSFLVRGEKIDIWVNDVQINGSSLEDWITSRTTLGDWKIETYASGKMVATATKTLPVLCNQGYGIWISDQYTLDLPVTFSAIDWMDIKPVDNGFGCLGIEATADQLKYREFCFFQTSQVNIVHKIKIEGIA